ncbi:MAG: hypothetical protein UT82_C0023G0006 [Parcubacteria group bacterium GW2011_GWB1_40_14]|nr:MAG: hypothetical protein UT82_C0023G0006 [Parcubacteria group bacterium GW2011_GWB1_40_14]
MFKLTKKRLSELEKNLHIRDFEAERQGFMSLELGVRVGLKTGYPELQFTQFNDEFILDVTIPSNDPEYDTRRDMTIDEMLTFVLVAKEKAPNERLTKELIKKVRTLLTNQKTEIGLVLEQIEQSLRLIEF